MPHEDLTQMKKHLQNAQKILEHLTVNAVTFEKHNDMSEAAAIQFESAVLEFRKLCEKNKALIKTPVGEALPAVTKLHREEVYGEVEITDGGWLQIRLNTLLPGSRFIQNSRYIADSIGRLLDNFVT